jgi:hypothetical protein
MGCARVANDCVRILKGAGNVRADSYDAPADGPVVEQRIEFDHAVHVRQRNVQGFCYSCSHGNKPYPLRR